jgi:hypothetical protein
MLRTVAKPGASAVPWVSLKDWFEELLNQTIIEPADDHRERAWSVGTGADQHLRRKGMHSFVLTGQKCGLKLTPRE